MSGPSFRHIKEEIADLIDDRIDVVIARILEDDDVFDLIPEKSHEDFSERIKEIVYITCMNYREQIAEGSQ